MNGAGEVDVVAPLKLEKYSGSLPVEHNTITSLLVAPMIMLLVQSGEVKPGCGVEIRNRNNLFPHVPNWLKS